MANIKPAVTYREGPANFISSVPALTPETFNPYTATEEREIVEATIKGVQAKKQAEHLAMQFNLSVTEGEI